MENLLGIDWAALAEHLTISVVAPFLAFLFPESMFYWPYLVSAVVLALAVAMLARRRDGHFWSRLFKAAFDRRIWLARSALADYRYYVVNGALFVLISAPLMVSGAGFGVLIAGGLESAFGSVTAPLIGSPWLKVAYTLTFFVLLDFGRYLAHLAQHRVPLLWEFHKVHHSAEVLTPITSGRLHPVDLWMMGAGENLGAGLATGIFFYIGGGEITFYTFLGVHGLVGVYRLIGHLRHSHVWLSYGRVGYLLISPAQHQIHHSALEKHWGRNCGFALAIWDWMFGTLYVPKEREYFPMGLGDGSEASWHGVKAMYVKPLVGAARLLFGGGSQPPTAAAGGPSPS